MIHNKCPHHKPEQRQPLSQDSKPPRLSGQHLDITVSIETAACRLEIQAVMFPILCQHASGSKNRRERQKGTERIEFHHESVMFMNPGGVGIQDNVNPALIAFSEYINAQTDENC